MAEIYDIKDELTVSDSCLCFLTPNTKVLEVGSATGYATKYMTQKLNCHVTCIEKSPIMADIGRQFANKMIVADIETDNWEKELLNEEYDFIMFADVLEHLKNPTDVIRRIKPYLKENGYIISSIPNIGHNSIIIGLRNSIFDYQEKGLLDNTHIFFMTRKSVNRMFNENGFYCKTEENKVLRPCDTEFNYYYCLNPLLALSIIAKEDAHVYRFVQMWTFYQREKNNYQRGQKFNLFVGLYELLYDLLCYIKRRNGLKTPSFITGIFHKPVEKKEKLRYEKYQP